MQVLINTDRSKLWVIENYTTDLWSELQSIPLHEEPPIKIMGKECRQRRNVGFFSNESKGYQYSGQIMTAAPLVPVLQDLLPD